MLTLCNITKFYGEKLILKNVSMRLGAGELALILGANGAGKSTLLRVMAQLAEPTSGTVTKKDAARIAYLGHSTFLYPALTAWENLAFQARINRLPCDADSLHALLAKVRLTPYAHEQARHFSRGMAQRLNFARALMLSPDIFLLDEPFTGMDAESTRLLYEETAARCRNGAAVALISHSPDTDIAMATHVFILAGGKLKFAGTADKYRQEFAQPC